MKTIQNLLILILIGIVVFLLFFRKPIVGPNPDTIYITDTIWVPKPYPVPEPYSVSVPPKTIKIYLIDSTAIDSLKILINEKDILIKGLNSEITVSQNYLKQYPLNPKLIELSLSYDTLFLSLLPLDGFIRQQNFPLRLSAFQYKWTNEGLSKEPIKPLPTPKTPISIWGGGGFNLLYPSPFLNITAEKDWARMRAFGDINVGLLNQNASSINLGLKYRLR